jgi:hypothetical protein
MPMRKAAPSLTILIVQVWTYFQNTISCHNPKLTKLKGNKNLYIIQKYSNSMFFMYLLQWHMKVTKVMPD